MSDSMDYMILEAFKDSFYRFQHGETSIFNRQIGRNIINEKKKY